MRVGFRDVTGETLPPHCTRAALRWPLTPAVSQRLADFLAHAAVPPRRAGPTSLWRICPPCPPPTATVACRPRVPPPAVVNVAGQRAATRDWGLPVAHCNPAPIPAHPLSARLGKVLGSCLGQSIPLGGRIDRRHGPPHPPGPLPFFSRVVSSGRGRLERRSLLVWAAHPTHPNSPPHPPAAGLPRRCAPADGYSSGGCATPSGSATWAASRQPARPCSTPPHSPAASLGGKGGPGRRAAAKQMYCM